MQITITKETFDWLYDQLEAHNERTHNGVDATDILFTYFNPGMVLNDWDEGRNNDPFWDNELNEHSAIVFIEQTVEQLKQRQ